MSVNTIVNEIQTRKKLIGQRLAAIDIEKAKLVEEDKMLDTLLCHYKKLEYDSLEEERRVTFALNSSKKSLDESKYGEMLQLIFSGKNPQCFNEIRKSMERMQGCSMKPGNVHSALNTLKRHGHVVQISKGVYEWLKPEGR